MDTWMSKHFWHLKKKIHWRTSVTDAWSDETVPNWSWCVEGSNCSSANPTGHKWRSTSSGLLIKNIYGHWKKIRNIWQRITWNYPSIEGMETLYPRVRTHDYSLFRSQELDIFPNCTKAEWQTSKMVALPIGIRHQAYTFTGNENDSIRCFIQTTWPWNRTVLVVIGVLCFTN